MMRDLRSTMPPAIGGVGVLSATAVGHVLLARRGLALRAARPRPSTCARSPTGSRAGRCSGRSVTSTNTYTTVTSTIPWGSWTSASGNFPLAQFPAATGWTTLLGAGLTCGRIGAAAGCGELHLLRRRRKRHRHARVGSEPRAHPHDPGERDRDERRTRGDADRVQQHGHDSERRSPRNETHSPAMAATSRGFALIAPCSWSPSSEPLPSASWASPRSRAHAAAAMCRRATRREAAEAGLNVYTADLTEDTGFFLDYVAAGEARRTYNGVQYPATAGANANANVALSPSWSRTATWTYPSDITTDPGWRTVSGTSYQYLLEIFPDYPSMQTRSASSRSGVRCRALRHRRPTSRTTARSRRS